MIFSGIGFVRASASKEIGLGDFTSRTPHDSPHFHLLVTRHCIKLTDGLRRATFAKNPAVPFAGRYHPAAKYLHDLIVYAVAVEKDHVSRDLHFARFDYLPRS